MCEPLILSISGYHGFSRYTAINGGEIKNSNYIYSLSLGMTADMRLIAARIIQIYFTFAYYEQLTGKASNHLLAHQY